MINTKNILHLNEQSLPKALNAKLLLIDFWAEWCAPCRMQNPILEELAEETGHTCLISKINVDENRTIAAQYEIRSIPTLILFKNGKIIRQFNGLQQKQTLLQAIQNS